MIRTSPTHFLLRFLSPCVIVITWLTLAETAIADVRLPGYFTDHMVLQQQQPIRIWGWADYSDEEVIVTLGDQTVTVSVNPETTEIAEDGPIWAAELRPMAASRQPLKLTVRAGQDPASKSVELNDILIGEVWLCSGQSNMEWSVANSANPKEEIAAADLPLIRHVKIPRRPSPIAERDVEATWQVCSPETVGSFTAVGYYMARHLRAELNVPIGLINSSWGGTRIEPWTPPVGFENVDALEDIHTQVIHRMPGTEFYQTKLAQYLRATENWLGDAKQRLEAKAFVKPNPEFPAEIRPFTSHQDPTMLYNGMIHPLVGYSIRGAIWYQGESNHNEGMLYFEKKKALVQGWRELWGQERLPFYFVQIAPFQYGNESPEILPLFWEAQSQCLEIEDTAMVVINDIATLNNIHPPNKQDVGKRLAMVALHNDYGFEDIIAHSPRPTGIELQGDHLRVAFESTGGGLKTRDGAAPSHFEIIDAKSDGFQPAEASIEGDSIVLRSDQVAQPVAMRFAWNKLAEPNLCGQTGLPVAAFRLGKLPEFFSTIPGASDYRLVYELDLAKLGPDFAYDVDESASIGDFDRVGYHLTLQQGNSAPKQVFVTMDAFTPDVLQIGIPTFGSGAHFQEPVKSLDVFSNHENITDGQDLSGGNIEFWPNNYGPGNDKRVPNASSSVFDFGDSIGPPADGYGSMQVHNAEARETIFAINKWKSGRDADLGIGNSSGQTKDWTFTGNASSYKIKQLRIFVREVK